MAQQYQFNVLGRLTATTNHDQRQQPADDGIDEREQHQTILADPPSATAIGVLERHRLWVMGIRVSDGTLACS